MNIRLLFSVNKELRTFTLIELHNEVEAKSYVIGLSDSVYEIVYPLCPLLEKQQLDCGQLMTDIANYLNTLDESYQSSRLSVVEYFGKRFQYQKYLEIGTFKDELFNLSKMWFPHCVGVDPEQGGTHRMTSDAFFASNTEMFDIIFIDGSHEANQVFRDVHNSLLVLNEGGTIIMHDCNPLTKFIQEPLNGEIRPWTGDTWKAAVAVRLMKDVEIVICEFDFGVGVIRRRENKHPLPPDIVKQLDFSPISMLDYEMLESNRTVYLRLMSFDAMINWIDEEFVMSN